MPKNTAPWPHSFPDSRSFPPARTWERRSPALSLDLRVTEAGGSQRPGEFVLYWMQASRRMNSNLALELAISEANRRRLPVLVFEALRPDTAAGNLRIHQFVLEGVSANREDAARRGISYHFFLPRSAAEGRGVIDSLPGGRRSSLPTTTRLRRAAP